MTHDVFQVFDTTLRDDAQHEAVNPLFADKLTIVHHLDDFGVGFIEGGWPGLDPRDTEFFARARREITLRHAAPVASGSTRRAGIRTKDDPQVCALVAVATPVVCNEAKSHDRHVEHAAWTTPAEKLAMIWDTVTHLRGLSRRVFVDCEHYFDGCRAGASSMEQVVRTAHEAGAEVVVLCDTLGGMSSKEIQATVRAVWARTGARLRIQTQDDTGCAVGNALAAVYAGATHIRCTADRRGRRVGDSDLFAVVAALRLEYGGQLLPEGALEETPRVSRAIAEAVARTPVDHQPYVGASAHAADPLGTDDAGPGLCQHVVPERVGDAARTRVSDVDSHTPVALKAQEPGHHLADTPAPTDRITCRGREQELDDSTYKFVHGLDRARREGGEPGVSRLRNREQLPPTHSTDCTLTVSLRHSRGALARLAATLSSMPVSALSYAVSTSEQATAEVRVAQADAPRARARLNRMVDVLAVTESQPTNLQ